LSHTKQRAQIEATLPQIEFVHSDKPFPAFVGGFGSGKTEALILRNLNNKLQNPHLNTAYYLPTYDLIKQIAFPRFEEKLNQFGISYKLNMSDKHITVRHRGEKGRIIFRTLDKPERIVGYEVADSDVDELDTLNRRKAEDNWNKIIARNRQKKPDGQVNTVGVGTTPEGFRFVYDRWEKRGGGIYQIVRADTQSNAHNLPDDYIDNLRATYPPQLLDAYIGGKFVNLTSGAVYPTFDRVLNGTDETIKQGEELHVGMDFNIYHMAAVVHVVRAGSPLALCEHVEIRDTPQMIEVLREAYPGHKISVYPDASGASGKSVNASLSDISLLREHFNIKARKANPPVRQRIVSMNSMFLNGQGDRRYLVNTELCPTYTQALEQQAYKDNGDPDKESGNDHPNDAAGYFINMEFPAYGRPTISNW